MTMQRDPGKPAPHAPAGSPADGVRGADLEPDLRADLETIGAAWPTLRQGQPPVPVDQAVLNAARRAVEPSARRPARWSLSWSMRSLGAIAAAAVVVLAVTVVVELGQESPAPPPPASDGFRLERSAAEADRDAGPAEAQENQGEPQTPAQTPAPASGAASPADAEAWIERLRALKAAGDRATFDEALAAFRASYPDYPLPPELLE
jgi:hypothetical protein